MSRARDTKPSELVSDRTTNGALVVAMTAFLADREETGPSGARADLRTFGVVTALPDLVQDVDAAIQRLSFAGGDPVEQRGSLDVGTVVVAEPAGSRVVPASLSPLQAVVISTAASPTPTRAVA